jgi:hypothetical protein
MSTRTYASAYDRGHQAPPEAGAGVLELLFTARGREAVAECAEAIDVLTEELRRCDRDASGGNPAAASRLRDGLDILGRLDIYRPRLARLRKLAGDKATDKVVKTSAELSLAKRFLEYGGSGAVRQHIEAATGQARRGLAAA